MPQRRARAARAGHRDQDPEGPDPDRHHRRLADGRTRRRATGAVRHTWNECSCANAPPTPAEATAATGKLPGRPRKLDPNQLAAAQAALDTGQTADQIAAAFGVSRATLYRNLTENKPADQQ
ncbi:helix-turn-helix domain-containing protein [Pseudonocardia sp. ICBG601]|uniref:helix-turn-helix domain-containing protein n=1 Tax=Pseudonocardia sp. ICBG601 TaxID=2846759 RepID=UPI0035ABE080